MRKLILIIALLLISTLYPQGEGSAVSSQGSSDNIDNTLVRRDANGGFSMGILDAEAIETPYQQTVTVAKSGGDYTTIQGAIDAIVDAAANKKYLILVYPGTYVESVVITDHITLKGHEPASVILTNSSGTVFTSDNGANLLVEEISIIATGTAEALNISAGGTGYSFTFKECVIAGVYDGVADDLMTINSGAFRLNNSLVQYTQTNDATITVTHRLINVIGADEINIGNSKIAVDIDDTNANTSTIVELQSGANCTVTILGNLVRVDTENTGITTFYKDLDTDGVTDRVVNGNSIHLYAPGGGTAIAYDLDNVVTTLRSISNTIHLMGGTKWLGDIGAAGTLISNFDDIVGVTVEAEITGAGTYSYINSPADDTFSVEDDIHAKYVEFDDDENTYIGLSKSDPTYFAFANDETNFWLGKAGDTNIWMNYEKDADVYLGAGAGGDTDVLIQEGNTNKTRLNQDGTDFKIQVEVTDGDISLEPNGTGVINAASKTTFQSDIEYIDTFWEDLRFPASRIRQGATQKPDFDVTDLGLLYPADDSTEIAYLIAQLPHSWKHATSIEPHIHWIQTNSDTVDFRIKYRAYDIGDAVPGSWIYVAVNNSELITYTSGTIHQIAEFPMIDMTGLIGSSLIDIQLYRIDDGGAGAVTGDVLMKEFDFHYEIDKPGSDNEIPGT